MAEITWTDSVGAAALSNSKASEGDRFSDWTPRSAPFGDKKNALADGALYVFAFRDDHSASFEMRMIPNTSMALMLRLQKHLESGGSVAVTTDDLASRNYATCKLAPGASVDIRLTDPRMLEYTMSFNLLNVAGSPTAMLCIYG